MSEKLTGTWHQVVVDGQLNFIDKRWIQANVARMKRRETFSQPFASLSNKELPVIVAIKSVFDKYEIPMIIDGPDGIFVLYDDIADIDMDLAASFVELEFVFYGCSFKPRDWKLIVARDGYIFRIKAWRERDDCYVRVDRRDTELFPKAAFDYLVEVNFGGQTLLAPI